ncbi:MAG: hypothetical protein ACLU6Y_03910 [Ruminococcus sp.]
MAPVETVYLLECRVSSEGKKYVESIRKKLYEDYLDGVSIDKIGDTVTDELKTNKRRDSSKKQRM